MPFRLLPSAIGAARVQAQAGEIPDGILKELGLRYAYRGCPAEDKAMIAEFDRTVEIPLLGWSRLPPEIMHVPGAKPPPIPLYYQNQMARGLGAKALIAPETAKHTAADVPKSAASSKVANAFISYSNKDAELLTQLHEHLSALQRQQLLAAWTDREIHAGGMIERHIDEQMESADLYLLLVSSAFIQSDYCYQKEFSRACERQRKEEAIIVPVIIREFDWKIPELRQFKALPEDGKPVVSRHWHTPDEAFANVAAGLRALIERGRPPSNNPLNPRKSPKEKFIADERHVTEEQRTDLRMICNEIVDRLTAKFAGMSMVRESPQ